MGLRRAAHGIRRRLPHRPVQPAVGGGRGDHAAGGRRRRRRPRGGRGERCRGSPPCSPCPVVHHARAAASLGGTRRRRSSSSASSAWRSVGAPRTGCRPTELLIICVGILGVVGGVLLVSPLADPGARRARRWCTDRRTLGAAGSRPLSRQVGVGARRGGARARTTRRHRGHHGGRREPTRPRQSSDRPDPRAAGWTRWSVPPPSRDRWRACRTASTRSPTP